MDIQWLQTLCEGQEHRALATIIQVKGSSPRHPGSKLLLEGQGEAARSLGSVGGGKGEARALEACQRAMVSRQASLLETAMGGSDIAGPEMVCGGANRMLIECLLDRAPYQEALRRLSRGEAVLLLKRILDVGPEQVKVDIALAGEGGNAILGRLEPGEALTAARVLREGQPFLDEAALAFFEPLFPEEKLVILGAGHVGQALAAAAPALGFQVTVVDDRAERLAPADFPECVHVLQADFAQAIQALPFDSATYAVVVTRGHQLDLACAQALMARPYRYAGLMGSARKTRFIVDYLLQAGFDPAKVATLWTPIGVDIGAETPAELALAILAEMIAVRRNARILPELKRVRAAKGDSPRLPV